MSTNGMATRKCTLGFRECFPTCEWCVNTKCTFKRR